MEMISPREKFDQDGYLFVPRAITDLSKLYCPPPTDDQDQRLNGVQKYLKHDKIIFEPVESQVNGSFARYNYPLYRPAHYTIKKIIQKILQFELLPTYFYERFYYLGQKLLRHTDRPACEISVSLQISTNRKKSWPIWFQLPDKSEKSVNMENGDMVIYKGCDIEHWRDPLQSKYNRIKKSINNLQKKVDDTYHHQIFFHYVNSQGNFVHHAYDQL